MDRSKENTSQPSTSLEKLSRRSFLSRAGAVGMATAIATLSAPVAAVADGGAMQDYSGQSGVCDGVTLCDLDCVADSGSGGQTGWKDKRETNYLIEALPQLAHFSLHCLRRSVDEKPVYRD